MADVTIFHYHLLPGGVTSVIRLGIKALLRYDRSLSEINIVCGLPDNLPELKAEAENEISALGAKVRINFSCVPELYYNDSCGDEGLEERIKEILTRDYSGGVWWVHNYQLGKNPSFTRAIVNIACRGRQKMILHIHDFPESARFQNLRNLMKSGRYDPYPVGGNVAYAVINPRDKKILTEAGMPEERIRVLNNPVPPVTAPPEPEDPENIYRFYRNDFPGIAGGAPLLLYPVRTIRRKNILEAGLIASASESPVNLAVTLPGVSASELRYSELVERAFRNGLIPGVWGSGADARSGAPSFGDFLGASEMVVSSAVQEGFGYLFANAVQWGKPLAARSLDILDGLAGIFPADRCLFYDDMFVPADHSLNGLIVEMYRKKLADLSEWTAKQPSVEEEIMNIGSGGKICFSYLPADIQYGFLEKMAGSGLLRNEVRSLNRDFYTGLENLIMSGRYGGIGSLEGFGLEDHAAGFRLLARSLSESGNTVPAGIQQKLLEQFAGIDNLRLLYDY